MEQIRDILKQMALQLELNIAMCDIIDSHDKRLSDAERSLKALKIRVDGAYTQLSKLAMSSSNSAYEARTAFPEAKSK